MRTPTKQIRSTLCLLSGFSQLVNEPAEQYFMTK
jgi:hypothetical protein